MARQAGRAQATLGKEELSTAVSQAPETHLPHHHPGRGHWYHCRCTDEGTKAQGGKVTRLKSHH